MRESPMGTGRVAAWCAALACTWLIAASAHASPSGADQVIVKFVPESAAGQVLSGIDLAAVADPAGDARLVAVARELGERIGIPLSLESLTSGRELLLALDQEALLGALAERLRRRDDVDSVEVTDPAGEGEGPRLAVAFEPDGGFADMVASSPRVTLGEGEIAAQVLSAERDRAVLALDADALMTTLLARLEADPAVQYAQPNLRLRPYRAHAGGQG